MALTKKRDNKAQPYYFAIPDDKAFQRAYASIAQSHLDCRATESVDSGHFDSD